MKKMVAILFVAISLLGLSACGSGDEETQEQAEDQTEGQVEEQSEEEPIEPISLEEAEQVVLDYINIFINGDDVEAKEQFVNAHVHHGMLDTYLAEVTEIKEEAEHFNNPEIVSSTDYSANDIENGKLVLVKGNDHNEEEIEGMALFIEEKFNWFYQSNDEQNDIFTELRSAFE